MNATGCNGNGGMKFGLTRRGFIELLGMGALTVAGGGMLAGCEKPADAPSPSKPSGAAGLTVDSDGNATITDMAGREVTFPADPQRVFSSSPANELFLAALVPERMIGWANDMSEEQLSYYPANIGSTKTIGGWYGHTEGNTEGIITEAPDVVISSGDVSTDAARESTGQRADELATKLGLPVICVSYRLADAPASMRNLGLWLGVEERGSKLADYTQGILDRVTDIVSKVPADKVPTYYYAEAADGLKTESADSFHVEVFQHCRLTCATDVEMSGFMGMEQVSMEQVLQWNPDFIFVYSDQFFASVKDDENWSDVTAVKNGDVYICPSCPQNWFDRSPNPLRVLGTLYATARVYPDRIDYDLDTEVKNYFKTLYDRDLTDEQVAALYLKGTEAH